MPQPFAAVPVPEPATWATMLIGFVGSAAARAGAHDSARVKSHAGLSDLLTPCMEEAGRERKGEAILARTFGDIVGSFPDLVRPEPPCADKRPVNSSHWRVRGLSPLRWRLLPFEFQYYFSQAYAPPAVTIPYPIDLRARRFDPVQHAVQVAASGVDTASAHAACGNGPLRVEMASRN